MAKLSATKPERKHFFFLNPYDDAAFTRCPKCQTKTKLRKFPLVIHIEPGQLLLLNKICRYCTSCDLIIAKKSEVEPLMAARFERLNPEIIGNDYLVIGVVDRRDWREGKQGKRPQGEIVERMFMFKDVLTFELLYPNWCPDTEDQHSTK